MESLSPTEKDPIFSFVKENLWKAKMAIDIDLKRGWGNGYVAIPVGHPWYGVEYDYIDADVHGGLTYGMYLNNTKKYWVIGFDTSHCDDDEESCPQSYVIAQTYQLYLQALDAARAEPL